MALGKKTKRVTLETIQAWVAAALRNLRLVVLLMCLSWMVGLAFYVFKRPVYTAKALFRVQSEGRVLTQEEFFKDMEFYSILKTLQQPFMIEKIAARFGIDGKAEFIQRRHYRLMRARALPSTGQPNVQEYEVTVFAYSRELAMQWIERAFEVYHEERAIRRREDRVRIIQESREEMARMQSDMRAYAAKQDAFRERTNWDAICAEWDECEGIPRRLEELERRHSALLELRDMLQNSGMTATQRLSILASRASRNSMPSVGQVFERVPPFLDTDGSKSLEGRDVGTDGSGPVRGTAYRGAPDSTTAGAGFVVMPDMVGRAADGWEALYQEKASLETERDELAKVYLSGHPKMRRVIGQLEHVHRELERKLDGVTRRLDWELFVLSEERQELRRKLPMVDEARARYEAAMEQFSQIKYGELPWGEKYSQLLKRMSVAKMELEYGSFAPEATDIAFMGYIHTPNLPVSPHRGKLLIFCLFLGVVLSTAAVVGAEYLDQTVALVDAAEEHLGFRGLGIVPLVPASAIPAGRHMLVDRLQGDHAYQRSLTETFRGIRANLLAPDTAGGARQVIMVTSSLPREGKSAVSMNLAVALARAGKRTLIIDADARRGRLQRELGVKSGPGLAEVLKGDISLTDVCAPTPYENLDLLGTGRVGTGLPELLISRRFSDGIAALRQKYEHIIIDTPPVLGLSEACDLLPCVDGVLLVIWAKYTPLRDVKASVSILQRNGARFLGFVMNRVDLTNSGYYYHYYYYSDYYYRSYEQQKLTEHAVVAAAEK